MIFKSWGFCWLLTLFAPEPQKTLSWFSLGLTDLLSFNMFWKLTNLSCSPVCSGFICFPRCISIIRTNFHSFKHFIGVGFIQCVNLVVECITWVTVEFPAYRWVGEIWCKFILCCMIHECPLLWCIYYTCQTYVILKACWLAFTFADQNKKLWYLFICSDVWFRSNSML